MRLNSSGRKPRAGQPRGKVKVFAAIGTFIGAAFMIWTVTHPTSFSVWCWVAGAIIALMVGVFGAGK